MFPLQLELDDAGNVVYTNTILYSALPPIALTLPAGVKLGLYDPVGPLPVCWTFLEFHLPS